MFFKCTEEFETREDGYPFCFEKGTVWMASYKPPAFGGYEIVLLEKIDDEGAYTGVQATVRLYRLSTSFAKIPPNEIKAPIGCSTFHSEP